MLGIIVYIDDGLPYIVYFGTPEGTLDRFKKELPARFNIDFMGTSHRHLSARPHQENKRTIALLLINQYMPNK
jgi:hypothetical protein